VVHLLVTLTRHKAFHGSRARVRVRVRARVRVRVNPRVEVRGQGSPSGVNRIQRVTPNPYP